MGNCRKNLKVLALLLVFTLLQLPVGEAAKKSPKSQKTTKAAKATQNSETKPPTSVKETIMPGKITINETKPPTSQVAKTYAETIKNEPLLIIVEKAKYKLYLFKEGKEIKSYDVAIGKNPGQKERVGDMTTPSGEFKVDEIIASNNWTHDFNDGKGEIEGAYGPWFVSLETGWIGIGIHGTHDPGSIGTMASEGCIRMKNDQVAELKDMVFVGAKVIVE